MKPLKEALISKNKRDWATAHKRNKYDITKEDLIENIAGFPLGVVIKMMEEQERQNNTSDVTVFQKDRCADVDFGGFNWRTTVDGQIFWETVIREQDFDQFFKKYPEYKKYDM